ncbi:MAG: L-threonylcarbamoyladenylate synthase, partial [Marinirhabdus sp.]
MLAQYVENVPKIAYDIVKYAVRPTTIIYDNPVHVASNLVAADNSLGIRVVKDSFCCQLLQKLKRPLVSTSANVSGESAPGRFSEVSNTILKGVDYVVPLRQNKKGSPPSALIKLKNNGRVSVLRE